MIAAGRRGPILGGPVCTRTASHSLHVNLMPPAPAGRLCNVDCLYCPFPRSRQFGAWPRTGDVGVAVMNALHDCPDIESITVSGPGEPTLHPRFGRALGEVLSARQLRPDLPVRVVTNAPRLVDPHVRRLLGFADERVVRLDAGGDRIARPKRPVPWAEVRDALAALPDFSVESVFVDGREGNTNESDVADWIERIASLGPQRVYVTTIAEPPLVAGGVRRADDEVLASIAEQLRSRTELPVVVLP